MIDFSIVDEIINDRKSFNSPYTCAEYLSEGKWIAWDYLRFISNKIEKAIKDGSGRIIVNVPPQHGKSLFISKWVPIWYLINYPRNKIILSTYEATFAANWGRHVRNEINENNRIPLQIQKDQFASNSWSLSDGGGMVTAGVGGPITGKSGDLIIIDDPVKNWDEARSEVYRRRNIDWFNSTLYTRKQPGTTFILLMTRWHENDLGGYLSNDHSDDWEVIRLPAIAEKDDILKRKIGKALCPERYNEEELEKTKKAVGSIVWSGLYQQRPSALEGGIIKRKWLLFYKNKDLPEIFDEIIQSWDLSFKKTTDGSYCVGQVWGRLGANFYLLDQQKGRWSFPETKKEIKKLSLKWKDSRRKIIEDKANGPAIMDDLKSEIPGLIPYSNSSSKEARLSAISVYFESGNVFIPHKDECNWVDDFIEEIVNFPNAKNDDQCDACSQALSSMHINDSFDISIVPGIEDRINKEFDYASY